MQRRTTQIQRKRKTRKKKTKRTKRTRIRRRKTAGIPLFQQHPLTRRPSPRQRGKQTQRPSLSLTQRERRNPITQKLLLVKRDIHVCFILQGHAGGTHARMCMMQPARQKQRRSQKLAHHRPVFPRLLP